MSDEGACHSPDERPEGGKDTHTRSITALTTGLSHEVL
jgi:hypothetical protein